MRLVIAFVMFVLLLEGIDTLLTSELCFYGDCFKVPRLVSILIGGLSFVGVYLLWHLGDFEGFLKNKNNKSKKIPIPSLNVDLISLEDKEWIEEIKQQYKEKKIIGYSKNGADAARQKAIRLGIEKCFIVFKNDNKI